MAIVHGKNSCRAKKIALGVNGYPGTAMKYFGKNSCRAKKYHFQPAVDDGRLKS
jgi:hypothetical protein